MIRQHAEVTCRHPSCRSPSFGTVLPSKRQAVRLFELTGWDEHEFMTNSRRQARETSSIRGPNHDSNLWETDARRIPTSENMPTGIAQNGRA